MAQGSGGSSTEELPNEADDVMASAALHGELGSLSSRERVSFWGVRGKKVPKPWRGRLRSRSTSYLKLFEGLPHGPTIFSALTLYDRHGSHPQTQLGCRNGAQEKVAWIDLDGRLVNADAATSWMKVGAQLGEPESFVWEGLCPLQRVLVVAVAAAAATSAKESNTKEVRRLRRVIYKRESALTLMREELGSLLSQVDIQRSEINAQGDNREPLPSDSLDELVELLSQVDMQDRRLSDLEEQDHALNYGNNEVNDFSSSHEDVNACEFLTPEMLTTPVVNRHLRFSDLTAKISPITEESPGSNNPGEELMEKMLMSSSWIDSLDLGLLQEEQAEEREYQFTEESVNKDVVFEQSVSERELEKENDELSKVGSLPSSGVWGSGSNMPLDATFLELSKVGFLPSNGVWESGSNMPPDATIHENHSALEWLSETSSVIMDPFSPMPSEKRHGILNQGTEEGSKDWRLTTATEEKSFADRARCANIILSVKKQVITLLDEAAANVLEALTFIGEKTRQLDGVETNALDPNKPEDALDKKCEVSSAIKDNVSNASARIAKLQTAMVQLWESFGPEAIASLDISPSDFEDYLANLQIAKILNDDACDLSAGNINIQTWKDWFRHGFDNPESSFLRKIQASEETESETPSRATALGNPESLSDWPSSASRPTLQKLSPGIAAVRQKVEKIMLPLFDDNGEPGTVQRTANLVTVAEELVAEFEKSATKVANLKTYVRACDKKRKQVEKKLLEAWEQDSKNQVKSGNEITELKRQVRLKEAAYQQLIISRKALVSSKTKEIAELQEDCRRQTMALQDMASAAKATQECSEKRLAMLEEICRKKDSSIMSLKEEIFELEAKVLDLQSCQTPAQLRPMNLPLTDRDDDTESTEDLFDDENAYRAFTDECQLRGSYQSLCGSENRRTSWGSDLSAQEFHIIDTPWSSELTAGQDFNIIEEAAFQGRSLGIFQNIASSQEFLRGSLRRLGSTPGGGLDANNGPSSSCSSGDIENSRPTVNIHREARKANNGGIPNYRKELSKSVTNLNSVTIRSKKRDDKLRSSMSVLSAVGPNTPFKPRRSTSASKENSHASLNGIKRPKENSGRSRQKWV